MRRINILILIILILGPGVPLLSGKVARETQEQRIVHANLLEEPIIIDGVLQEKAWQGKGYSGFIQSAPQDGAPATEKTVVWVAYDKNALYIAARLYDSEPGKIVARLARRDVYISADWFFVSIDPYYNRRTGYEFAVNAAGSIMDSTIYNDEKFDNSWDGVWESKTKIDDKGWIVELRIPYDQLRFKKKKQQVWGITFARIIKRKHESANFVWLPRGESGYVSRFAKLTGLKGVKPGRFIEVLPFTAAKAAFTPEQEGNPFETGKEYSGDAGVDLKMALKTNLTLDLSVNPDFGEVEVDPAVINLTAVETYYEEKRPFFIEGADIFRFGLGGANRFEDVSWAAPRFFYSRRIGRRPQGFVTTPGFVDYPDWTTILAAAKITGRISREWNIGFISALTQREYAEIDQEGVRSGEEIEPFSYYGVLRVQKEYKQGKQGLGFITTAVIRNLRTENLENTLTRNAFSFAVDGWTFLDKKRTWVVTGWWGGTRISGNQSVIGAIQRSYPHYFQRPDATHVRLDDQATSMRGWAGRFTINKQRGNFLFNAAIGAISPGFNSTDIGFQSAGDRINSHIMVGYRWFKPGKIFRQWDVNLTFQRNYDFGGNPIGEQGLLLFANFQFLNYWGGYMRFSINPAAWDNIKSRGGPLVRSPSTKWGDFNIYSDSRKPLVFNVGGLYFEAKYGNSYSSIYPGLSWKPSNNFWGSISLEYTVTREMAQWVANIQDEWMTDTYGTRYVFSELDQKTLSCSIRFNWTFNPKLSLQAYLQPFISVGAYDRFKELARPASYDFNVYGQGNSEIFYASQYNVYIVDPDSTGPIPWFYFRKPDFNYKSLRGTVVLRWEYRPGSTLYLVWTQKREDFSNPGDFRFGRDFSNLLKAKGDNIFMLKFTYQLKF